ncbi:MAG TPA: hypothetical protein VMD99_06755 [Terriglobales bacterium]|nr:hypothetical protein [Terriglobales bacterium]
MSPSEIKEVIQAVEDEIYDYGYNNDYYQLGANLGTPEHWIAHMSIYVDPNYDLKDGGGQVIYKYMPYGQIIRFFSFNRDGLVQLDGNPENHFPITQPSHQTVFMDDEDVCRLEHAWLKDFFDIDVSPSLGRIRDAVRRQKDRTGFSDWEYRHAGNKGK